MSSVGCPRFTRFSLQERIAIALSTAALISVAGLMVLIAHEQSAMPGTPIPGPMGGKVATTVTTVDGHAGKDARREQAIYLEGPVLTIDDAIATGSVAVPIKVAKSPQQTFIGMLPRLAQADEERRAACDDLARAVVNKLAMLDQLPIPQELVDTVTSLSSKVSYTADAAGHRRWVANQFENQVLSADDLATIVRSALDEFQSTLNDIDNRLLVDLRADIALDPASMTPPPLEFGPIEKGILEFQSSLHSELSESIQADLASFFASLVAGEVGTMGARAYMADENGELDATQEVAAWLTGFVVGAITDAVVSEVMSVDNEIIARCRDARASILLQVMPAHDDGKLWYVPACNQAWEHRNRLLAELISELAIDADWAITEYKAYAAASEVE